MHRPPSVLVGGHQETHMKKQIDLVKLAALRDSHARLHADYRSTAERAREAMADVARIRTPAPSGTYEQQTATEKIMQLSVTELRELHPESLTAAGLTKRVIQRVIDAQARADSLRKEAETLSKPLHRSSQLIARLNEYASPLEAL